jgi:CRISPR/Cas system-associated protein Cas10 (large subunit of type III CRISPR-Cas system)
VNTKRRARKEAKLEQDGMRRCVVCGKVRAKTLENFQRDENGADGLSDTCVFCIREKES